MRRIRLLVSFFLVLLAATAASAQPPTQVAAMRPRIGLALSGGSALGLAHIGVLRYFDEHHIPVDVIAGTSMGGLVGGFYATGLDGARLQDLARHTQWNDLLRANPKYIERPISEKQDFNRASAGITLRFKGNLSLPAGLNPGQPLALLLSRYTAAYADIKSFDDLPIPFRCVTTDLTRDEAYTPDHGSLPLALRATMALPGIFTPVKWEDRVLVDGGVLDNIPVDAARAMHADVVIAVRLEKAPASAKTLTSLTDVLKQVVAVVVLQNEKRSLEQANLTISVPLQQFGLTDFDHAEEIMAAGYAAAQSMAGGLARYELGTEAWQQYLADRQSRVRPAPASGPVVAVNSSQANIEAGARQELARKLPGVVTREKLEETLTSITSATSLPSAFYGWGSEQGRSGYKIAIEPRPYGGNMLIRPSLSMQVSAGEPSRTALHLSTVTALEDAYKSKLLAEVSIGYDPALRAEYYRPSGGEPYFVAPGFLLQRTNFSTYSGAQVTDQVRDRFAGTLYAGVGTLRFVQWRIGATAGYDHYSRDIAVDGVHARSGGFADLESNLIIDTQDSEILPTRGTRLSARLGYSVRDSSYPYFDSSLAHTVPLSKDVALFAHGHGSTSFGRKLALYDQFTGGGITDLSAYRFQEFHANTMATAGGGAYFSVSRLKVSDWKPVVAVWHDVGRFDLGSRGWATHQSTSAGLFGPSPLGPVGLVLSTTENGKLRFRFVFGRF